MYYFDPKSKKMGKSDLAVLVSGFTRNAPQSPSVLPIYSVNKPYRYAFLMRPVVCLILEISPRMESGKARSDVKFDVCRDTAETSRPFAILVLLVSAVT